jgi:pyrroline-5-carboxylate reductase
MVLDGERIAVIGCGTMGEAVVKGLLRNDLIGPENVTVSHPRPERRAELEERYGVVALASNGDAARHCSFVVLAVKPQYLDDAEQDLVGKIDTDATVITIVAGLRMAEVERRFSVAKVVRAMPNTPGQLGKGITVWCATPGLEATQRSKVSSFLSALGEEEYVTHENELDMATALSGTGPAYAFLFMEAMVDAGVHLGFSRRLAFRLVIETLRGSVEYAAHSPEHLAKLRNHVTSPGGTTAEACYQLEKGRLRTVLSDAVWAAFRRCQQLGRQEPSDTASKR